MKFVLIILVFFPVFSFTQSKYEIINETKMVLPENELSFSHKLFHFRFKPVYTESELVDVFYQINYKETNLDFENIWVDFENGHLINYDSLSSIQWKGPFSILDGTRYKFLIELKKETNQECATKITIFKKGNPKSNNIVITSSPYDVKAHYYDTSMLKTSMDVYSIFSTIKTIYDVYKGLDIKIALIETVVEEALDFAIDIAIQNLPIIVELKSKATSNIYRVQRNNLDDFVFNCPETGREIKIHFFR